MSVAGSTFGGQNTYLYDEFIEAPDLTPQEQHYENLKSFLQSYNEKIRNVQESLRDEVVTHGLYTKINNYSSTNTITTSDPIIQFHFTPIETLHYDELLQTEHAVLKKVLLVFAQLIEEMNFLISFAKNNLYSPLSIFGIQVEEEEDLEGEKQLQFGRAIPLLMDLWNFCARCNLVVKHTIQQLASLYNPQMLKDKQLSTFSSGVVHLDIVYQTLGNLLTVLITLDEIIIQNNNFQHYLTLYKRMISKVMSEPERYGTTKQNAGKIYYLLEKIEGDVLDDSIFKSCLNQAFDETIVYPGGSNNASTPTGNETPVSPTGEVSGEEIVNVTVQRNNVLKQEFEFQLKNYFSEIQNTFQNSLIVQLQVPNTPPTDIEKIEEFIGLTGLYILYVNLWMDHQSLKKFFKQIWEFQRKIPIIHLFGNTVFSPAEFLTTKIPDMMRIIGIKNPKKEIDSDRLRYLENLTKNFPIIISNLVLRIEVFQSRFESNLELIGKDSIALEATLILQGISLANQISYLIKTFFYIHILTGKSLNIEKVNYCCQAIEMLKSLEMSFVKKMTEQLGYHISVMLEFLTFKVQKFLTILRNRLSQTKKKQSNFDIDQLAGVLLSLHLLDSGSPSKKRLTLLKMALNVALFRTSGLFKDTEFFEVLENISKLEVLSNFTEHLYKYTDCSFLYWNRSIIPVFFGSIFENPSKVLQLTFMVKALQDPVYGILLSKRDASTPNGIHLKDGGKSLVDSYKNEIISHLTKNILDPLCQEIETDLRLNIHNANNNNDQLQKRKSVKGEALISTVKDVSLFFKTLQPMKFYDEYINVQKYVENYLSRTFYEFTVIANHDWKNYEEMRSLALQKYNLTLVNSYLPGQTLDQGLDVLEITRNIHTFVTKFSYHLNSNIFIEQPGKTDAKNLHVLNIRHVANSIRTHGTGIMNTTINFVYRYLGKKLYVFSQFLFDDHIKSLLIKDNRFYKEEALKLDNKFPFKKAKKLVKDIKNLGAASSGISYLDQFRLLITEIGNALGYVRMVRAGGLRYIADAIQFVPINSFPDIVDEEKSEGNEQNGPQEGGQEGNTDNTNNSGKVDANNISVLCKNIFSDETAEAANQLHQVVYNMTKISQSSKSDYFKTLETVFKNELQKEQNSHLKNFFIIIPALTLSFVDAMLISKDKMLRSGKEANFTDDGFALGVTFILKVLSQNGAFDSLHWFESVAKTLNEERNETRKKMSEVEKKKKVEDELQTMKLTLNRIDSYKREFELLFFSFSGAKVFFRD
ncbi:hypothetical protein ABK040_012049 [Willaertia magna]